MNVKNPSHHRPEGAQSNDPKTGVVAANPWAKGVEDGGVSRWFRNLTGSKERGPQRQDGNLQAFTRQEGSSVRTSRRLYVVGRTTQQAVFASPGCVGGSQDRIDKQGTQRAGQGAADSLYREGNQAARHSAQEQEVSQVEHCSRWQVDQSAEASQSGHAPWNTGNRVPASGGSIGRSKAFATHQARDPKGTSAACITVGGAAT